MHVSGGRCGLGALEKNVIAPYSAPTRLDQSFPRGAGEIRAS